jgi:hypothetical protein
MGDCGMNLPFYPNSLLEELGIGGDSTGLLGQTGEGTGTLMNCYVR